MNQPNDPHNQPGGSQSSGDLGNELRELGQQLEQAVRATFESERAKQFQRDIVSGMKEIGNQLQSALKTIQTDERFQNLAERGQQTLEQARQSSVAHDLQETIARGITSLNDQLAAFIARQQSDASSGSSAPGADTTPSGASEPTTGETRRLDPDQYK